MYSCVLVAACFLLCRTARALSASKYIATGCRSVTASSCRGLEACYDATANACLSTLFVQPAQPAIMLQVPGSQRDSLLLEQLPGNGRSASYEHYLVFTKYSANSKDLHLYLPKFSGNARTPINGNRQARPQTPPCAGRPPSHFFRASAAAMHFY